MDEKDLITIWNRNTEQQKSELFNANYIALAKSRSKSIFNKIKTYMYIEMVGSVLVAATFPFLFYSRPRFFWVIMILMWGTLFFSFKLNIDYLRKMKNLNAYSVENSLKKKLDILKQYIKKLSLYVYIGGPAGFLCGFLFALDQEEISVPRVLFLIAFSAPFLALLIWLSKKYINWLYGRRLTEVQYLYDQLITEQE